MLEEGQEYAVMLYTWRSCSRAIPQVTRTQTVLTSVVAFNFAFSRFFLKKISFLLLGEVQRAAQQSGDLREDGGGAGA